MKESQLFREKNYFLGLCFNMFKPCACPVSLTSIHTQQQAMWRRLLALINCSRNTSADRWHERTTRRSTRSIAIEVKHETLPANRARLLDCTSRSTGMRHAVGEEIYLAIVLGGHHLVMTGHNAWRPRTGRERGPWWRLSEASYLTVWTLNDRFFASLVYCMLRRVLSEYWRKETEKSKVVLWGCRFGRSLLCPGRAEKETRGSWPTTGCLPVDRNKLGPDSWRDEKGVWDRTHTQTHTHTHTHTHTRN